MPPKRKDLVKPKAKAKSRAQDPQSENDFLEAADEFEAAAGKWRAGDAAKATRFFNRAIDMYNEGLKRYPNSFDLAYNKANLEYNIIEDDRIVAQLGNKTALLEETLSSHRFAATLNSANTDIQFNTGQVLTSLAEILLESGNQATTKVSVKSMLEEAVDIFTKCLETQQNEYAHMQAEFTKANTEVESDQAHVDERRTQSGALAQENMETESTSSDAPGEWAIIEEAVTPEAILDTCTAQLGALTPLLGLYTPTDATNISARMQLGLETTNTKIPTLLNLLEITPFPKPAEEPKSGPTLSIASPAAPEEANTTPKDDVLLATANFQASVAEVSYRSNQSTSVEYAQTVEQIFTALTEGSEGGDVALGTAWINTQSAYADALMDLASAIADSPQYTTSSHTILPDLETQWTALTQAQSILTQLSTGSYTSILSPSRLADIFLARGDIDLFRFRISLLEIAKPTWINSKDALISNAGVFYRGARSYAEKARAAEVRRIADAKAIVAEILKEVPSGSGGSKEYWKRKSRDVMPVLEQMVEEGIIGRHNAEGVLQYTE